MITKKQLDAVERFADKLWAKVGLDIEFTRHFLDRVNDARNKKDITTAELTRLFRQSFKRHGKKIANLGTDAQAIIKDMETDINMPFVIQLDKNGELDLVAKTVMRKKDFKSSNQKFTVEDAVRNSNKYTTMDNEQINEAAATVKLVVKALKLKGGKEADALIKKLSKLDQDDAVSKADAEAAKKILKGQIAKFVASEETELEEAAAPFKSLEAAWLRTDGDKKKQDALIKKHELKPIISNVRPGAVKLGVLNKLKNKGNKPHTVAGLDAEGELIFVTNNPTKIYYPKANSNRPEGTELKEASMETIRLRRVVELSVNESNVDVIDGFLAESNIDLTWTPSEISKAFDKHLKESVEIETANELTKDEYEEVQNFQNFNAKDWKWNAAKKKYVRKKPVKESVELEEAKAETYDYSVIMKLLRSLRLMPTEQLKILFGLEGKGKKGVYTWDAIEKTLKQTGFGKFADELHGAIKPHMIGGSLGNKAWNVQEETLDEASDYKIYHKAFYSATDAAIELAAKRGFEVDEDDWFRQVSTGNRKPSEGKTNEYHISLTKNGKPVNKKLHFQVYGMGKGSYELNAYVESADVEGEILTEAKASTIDQVKKIVDDSQAAKINGKMVDMWTASMIAQIYDKVNDATKKKLENEKIEKLVAIAQKMMESEDLEQACNEVLAEAKSDKQKDIEDLEKMIKNPDPSKVKQYGGTKYVDMLKKKLSKLQEGLDAVGSEDDDVDNDGDVDASDKYLKKRRKAITKAVKKDK